MMRRVSQNPYRRTYFEVSNVPKLARVLNLGLANSSSYTCVVGSSGVRRGTVKLGPSVVFSVPSLSAVLVAIVGYCQ